MKKRKKYKSLISRFLQLIVFLLLLGGGSLIANTKDSLAIDRLFEKARFLSYGHKEEFRKTIDSLINIAIENDYQIRLGKYYCLKGRVFLNNDDDWKSALNYFLLAEQIGKKEHNQNLQLEVKNNLAYYYSHIQNFEVATRYIYYLIHNYTRTTDKILQGKITNTIGNYYSDISYFLEKELNDSAIYYFNKSINFGRETNSSDLIAANYINLGIAYYDKKEYKLAKDNYMMAIHWSEKTNDSIGIAGAILNVASVYFDEENYTKAVEYYIKAINYYQNLKYSHGIYQAEFLVADSYAALGDYKSAFNYYKSGVALYDSIYTIDKEKAINDLLIKYETDKKENEIELKNEQLKLEKSIGEKRNIIIISLIGFIIFSLVIWIFIMQSIRNKNKLISKEVEIKNQEINKLLKEQELKSYSALLEGQDKERQRIAADLHDRLGGLLSTVKAYFSVIEDKISSLEEKTRTQHSKATELLNKAVEEVRNISHDLHSGVLKNFGLTIALQDLKNTIEMSGSLKVELFLTGEKQLVDATIEIEIYRMIQELFSNTMKHAKASVVTLQIIFEPSQINIIFEDDGIGFDTSKEYEGIGLKSIKSRIMKIHGDFQVDSHLKRGTITIINIPLP